MISRVAENLCWLARYLERTSATARLLQVASGVLSDVPDAPWWTPLLIVSGEQPAFVERFGADHQEDAEAVMAWLTWNEDCSVSLVRSVAAARENARTTRDAISREVWETLNALYLWLASDEAKDLYRDDPVGFFGAVVRAVYTVQGAAAATMLIDEPLAFLRLGRALERADQTARALDVKHHMLGPTAQDDADTSADLIVWMATLLACTSYEAYFKRNRGSLRARRVARLLLLDATVPASVLACLLEAASALRVVSGPGGHRGKAAARLDLLIVHLRTHGVDALLASGIHEELTSIVEGLAEVGALLYTDFFDPPIQGSVAPESAGQ